MAKPKSPKHQRRSRGGRPRKEGPRYPGGQLKPAGPNERSVEIRKSLGMDKLNQRMIPLDVAHRNGWLSDVDYLTAIRFANLHQTAGFAQFGGSMSSNLEVDVPTEVSLSVTMEAKSFFSSLPNAELAQLWDRVFSRGERDPVRADEAAAKANRLWRVACAAMTMQERSEVTNVCILDSWPQWLIQRLAGHEDTAWERKRDLLVSGLSKIRKALRQMAPAPTQAQDDPDPPVSQPSGPLRTERFVYVDENGNQVLEVERITRGPPRAA